MEKTNNKKLDPKSQYELRKQVVRLKNKGYSGREISDITSLTQWTISRIWQTYQREGANGIKLKRRGRSTGEKRRLTTQQEKELKSLMVDKTPEQLKFPFALWTRRAVQIVVKKRFNIDLPLRTITDYLKRWGFTPQKPIKIAYEQNPVAVKRWLDETYPSIKERAKLECAEIQWGDETGVEADDYRVRGFAPRGQTPTVRLTGSPARTRINMISSITNQGKVRFMLYDEKMTSIVFMRFLKRLMKDSTRKIFLIVDNLKVHHSKMVTQWIMKPHNNERLELFFMPSYSPQLNPDERLNSDMKQQVQSGLIPRSKIEVKSKVRSALRLIQNRPNRVKKYFQDPMIAYAA